MIDLIYGNYVVLNIVPKYLILIPFVFIISPNDYELYGIILRLFNALTKLYNHTNLKCWAALATITSSF